MSLSPDAIAVTDDGSVWFCDRDRGALVRLDGDGVERARLALDHPTALASCRDDVAVATPGAIVRVDSSGQPSPLCALEVPISGLAVDPELDRVYASTKGRVICVADGEQQTVCEAFAPAGLALSADRRLLYVAAGDRILCVPRDDAAQLVVDRLDDCCDIALTAAGFAAVLRGANSLIGINPRHQTRTEIWRARDGIALEGPAGVAFERASRGYLVADTGNRRIVRISRDGGSAEIVYAA